MTKYATCWLFSLFLLMAWKTEAKGPAAGPAFAIDIPSGRSVVRFAVGDVDGDGLKDIVIVGQNPKKLYILLQKKDHTFAKQLDDADYDLDLDMMPHPWGVGIGDFDGDKKDDVVVRGGRGKAAVYIIQSGENPKRMLQSGNNGYEVYAADLNKDGLDDIISDGDVWFQVKTGQFRMAYFYELDNYARARVGDFNGDGHNDAAFSSRNALVRIFWHKTNYGDSKRTVKYQKSYPDVSLGQGKASRDIAMGDFNGDKRKDIAVATAKEVDVFTQKGANGFDSGDKPENVIAGFDMACAVEAADWNSDGLDDIAIAEGRSWGKVYVFFQRSHAIGKFANTRQRADLVLECGPCPKELHAVDINNDGLMDLAVLSDSGVSIYLGQKK